MIGNNRVLLCAAKMLIGILDVVHEFRQLSEQELGLKRDLKVKFLGMTAVEKLRAKQAARLATVKAAEASSKLFYLQANGRRRKNFIQSINSGTDTVFSHEDKVEAIYSVTPGFKDKTECITICMLGSSFIYIERHYK